MGLREGREIMDAATYCKNCKHKDLGYYCKICEFDIWDGKPPSKFEKRTEQKAKEAVNHPDHYKTGNFECIDVMLECFGVEAVKNFCLLNAFKYLYRCEHKEKRLEDIKKGMWYLEKFIELESANNGKS